MGKIIAVIIVLIWCFCGLVSILKCKDDGVNIFGLIFFISAPFLAFLLKFLIETPP